MLILRNFCDLIDWEAEMLDLNFSVDLIDNLIELYFFAFVSDVSTRISLLIWSTSATTMYFCSKERDEKQFLIFCWVSNSDVSSIAIRRYCEVSAARLIEEQSRDVESSELIETADLNDLNRLIDDLTELYLFASVNDVSTRIFLLIESMSTTTRYFDFDELTEARFLILWISKLDALIDLINDVKFVSSAICEILASWLTEKQIRDVELRQLMKILDLIDLNRLIDDMIELYFFAFVNDVSTRIFLLIWSTSATTMYFYSKERDDFFVDVFDLKRLFKFDIASIAICRIFATWLTEKQIRDVELRQLMKILDLINLIDVEFDWSANLK